MRGDRAKLNAALIDTSSRVREADEKRVVKVEIVRPIEEEAPMSGRGTYSMRPPSVAPSSGDVAPPKAGSPRPPSVAPISKEVPTNPESSEPGASAEERQGKIASAAS